MAQNTGSLSHIHGTRTLALSWMHVKSMADGGQRKKTSKLTLLRSGSSRSPTFLNVALCQHQKRVHIRDHDIVRELSRLHENFVIVPADKASNNYTFVCKRHYVSILTEELGLYSLPENPTYNLTDFSASEVLDNHKSVLTSFGIEKSDDELKLDLPYVYWIPKTHKYPYKHRSIAGWFKCSAKPLSILRTKLLTKMYTY